MTDEDRRAIEQDCTRLINLYAQLIDRQAWDEAAALYTAHGLMVRPSAPDQPIVGREAILASFRARPRGGVTRHFCANIVVTVEGPTAASAESSILLFTGKLDPDGGLPLRDAASPLVGEYEDRLELTADGWRFTERRGRLAFKPQ